MTGAEQDLARRLGQFELFSMLPADLLLRMAKSSVLHSYGAREEVFCEGDEINSLLLVLEGDVCAVKRSSDGREQVLAHLKAGDLISLAPLLLQKNACHTESGRASQPTKVLSISLELFHEIAESSPEFHRTLQRCLAGRLEQLSFLAASLSLQSARSRLAAFLIRQADQGGQPAGITQEEIAAEIGTVREIVARLLRDFARAGWLERKRQHLALKNRAALEEEAQRW
ncbi:MAG: Crp/Fnr family transcriptional regulator [Anaerolineaceae bacterium]